MLLETCEVVGSTEGFDPYIARTTNGGATFTAQTPTFAAGYAMMGLSCPTSNICVAIGMNENDSAAIVLRTTDAGTKWTHLKLPAGMGFVASILCRTASTCFAAGATASSGAVAETSNGGTTWRLTAAPGSADIRSVACSGPVCEAVGASSTASAPVAYGSADNGSGWTEQSLPAGLLTLESVSVDGTGFIAVGANDGASGVGGVVVRYSQPGGRDSRAGRGAAGD